MLSMVAVLPQPPLLVPELATGAAAETVELRAACLTAAARLGAAASRWIAVGADPAGRAVVPPRARGSFIGFGVDVVVALDTTALDTAAFDTAAFDTTGPVVPDPPDPELALPMLIAGWAAQRSGVRVRIRGELVAPDASAGDCAALGAELAAECAADPGPVGLLVLGDGAATHTGRAPGHLDERAGPFDATVAAALRAADPLALAALDPVLATALLAAGRAPWQVLAGAVAASSGGPGGQGWRGELLHSSQPYGVAYHVAVWTPAR